MFMFADFLFELSILVSFYAGQAWAGWLYSYGSGHAGQVS